MTGTTLACARLGLRLSWSTTQARRRGIALALAAAVGTGALLLVVGRSEAGLTGTDYSRVEMARLGLAIVVAVAVPVAVLAATVARLSAMLRERRLANLRLLGLSPPQTRLVAATEAVVFSVTGTTLGLVAVSLAGAGPDPVAGVLLAALVPGVTVLVASTPNRLDTRSVLARAGRADVRRPTLLRALPLALGVVATVVLWVRSRSEIAGLDVLLLLGGITLIGVGLIVLTPVFVRALADLLLRFGRGPTLLITGRRLQAQPAGVTRVVAGLMIGLFLVSGARCVIAAFTTDGSYAAAASAIDRGEQVTFQTTAKRAPHDLAEVTATHGVQTAVGIPVVELRCGRHTCSGYVASCATLAETGAVSGCTGAVQWLGAPDRARPTLRLRDRATGVRVDRPRGHASMPRGLRSYGSAVLLPPTLAGVDRLTAHAPVRGVVTATPGTQHLAESLEALGLDARDNSGNLASFDFVTTLRHTVWSIAAVVLCLGLLTFAVAGVDRALSRRPELASLRVIGTPVPLLRRTQWLEATLPTAVGGVLAILGGLWAGAVYLRLAPGTPVPWQPEVSLAAITVLGAVVAGGLTVIGTGAAGGVVRLRQD